jgi:hypothetical protein
MARSNIVSHRDDYRFARDAAQGTTALLREFRGIQGVSQPSAPRRNCTQGYSSHCRVSRRCDKQPRIGAFARKVESLALGIVFGLGVGPLLAFVVAQMQHGYLEIMLPGGMVGLIVGYATQRCGQGPQTERT